MIFVNLEAKVRPRCFQVEELAKEFRTINWVRLVAISCDINRMKKGGL